MIMHGGVKIMFGEKDMDKMTNDYRKKKKKL